MATNSYVQVPPDSTGKKLFTKQHSVDGSNVEVQASHIADPTDAGNILKIDNRGSASIRFTEGQPTLSGFGALNVSQPSVLGVYESSSGDYDSLFSILEASGGVSSYDDTAHGVLLTVTGASGSQVKRTTNRYHYYLPGSANIILMTTACSDTGKTGNVRRWGAFDDNDGVFFELYESTVNAVIRSSTTGSVVENKAAKSAWNTDKLDGTGPSGIILDVTKINIWWIDYQWLGSGRVRFGVFHPDGSRVTCHIFYNAGQYPIPYMRTGTLPLATQNLNFGATGSTSELRESCLAIYSEGSHHDYTFWRQSDLDSTAVTVGTSNTNLLAIRSKETVPGLNHHNSIIAYPETLNVYTDQPVRIDMWDSSTATGGTWNIGSSAASIEANNTATLSGLVSPFKTIFFAPGAHTVNLTEFFEVNDEGIMLNADGTAKVWAITGKKLGATDATVSINLGYKELW